MLLKMASRNLWRAKRRTSITLFTVAFGVWLSVTFTGMGDYTYTRMLDTGARMGFGHVTVEAEGYHDAPGIGRPLVGAVDLAVDLAARPDVDAAAPRISGQAMFATASRSVGGVLFALDPKVERAQDNTFVKAIVEGEMFDEPNSRGIVIGRVMARKLGLRLGKRIVYTMVDRQGELVSEVAKVCAIFDTGVEDVDGSVALLPLGRVQQLVGYGRNDATNIAVYVADHRATDEIASQLSAELRARGAEVLTYKETQPELAGMVSVDRAMNRFFQLLVALLIGAGVLNTILMSVLERRHEFGVMMAIGARPGDLFGMIIVESLLVGGLGVVAGAVITAPWYIFLREVGLDFSEVAGGSSVGGVLVDPVARITLFPESALAIVFGTLLLTVMAGLYPAWQASSQRPVDTLKAV